MTLIQRHRSWRTLLITVALTALAVPALLVFMSRADAQPTSPLSKQLARCGALSREKPTVVLVHGAWADASSWNGEVERLLATGYPVRAVANPLQGLTSDAASVAAFLATIKGPIVLVGHSYGGSVITNAAAGNANVMALVYVDAAAPDVGETNGQLSGATSALSAPASTWADTITYPGAPAGATYLYLKKSAFLKVFGNDLPRATALRLWATQRPASTAAFRTPSQAAAWKTIPSWYFISSGDQIITPGSELFMARRAQSKVTHFQGGSHLTLISHPGPVARVIGAAICSVR